MNRKLLFLLLTGILILSMAACTGVTEAPVDDQSQDVPGDTDMDTEEGHDNDADTDAGSDTDVDHDNEAVTIDAALIFSERCSECHGDNREGSKGPPLLPGILTKDPAVYINTITNGSGPMPTWGSRLSAEEINALVDFILSEIE